MFDQDSHLDNESPPEHPDSPSSAAYLRGAATRSRLIDPTSEHPLHASGSRLETAHVAVVFVHGMGTSAPGDMLVSYMNPSLDWIKRATTDDHTSYLNNDFDANLVEGVNILDRDRKPGLSPQSSQLVAHSTTENTVASSPTFTDEIDIDTVRYALLKSTAFAPAVFQPSYIDVDLNKRTGDQLEKKKLVAVEAWWDGEFQAPPFRQVAQWALGVAPSLILRHLALLWSMSPGQDAHTLSVTQPTMQKNTRPGFVNALCFTLVGGLLAILFQWIICILLLLGSIPFLRKYVSTIILKMTTSFGDVLTYVHDGVRSAAIRTTVLRSFNWLHANYQVENIIVVAHSLGTVIAYDVLNSRNFLRKISGQEITFVTFGSPLKKTNVLLQLKRDEQRVSLGILFAMLSLLCAVAAVLVGVYEDPLAGEAPLNFRQWSFIVSMSIGIVALGIGAHGKPVPLRLPLRSMMLNLSIAQYLGCFLGGLGIAILIAQISGWPRLIPVAILIAFVLWTVPVSLSRLFFVSDPHRLSQSLTFGMLLLLAVVVAALNEVLPLAGSLLLAALILSVLTASNPLEEFQTSNFVSTRKPPKFSFGIPIKSWIDFWATNDLVAEYGLGDVQYTTTVDPEVNRSPISRRVTNLKSYISDHTSYKQNLEQFIAPMTRLFLEELGFREPGAVAGKDLGVIRSAVGCTPISGNYEQDITTTMQSRANRVRWMSWAGTILLATMLLFSPGVYRSVGEYIVFDERNPVSLSGTGEPIDAPAWFTTFYNAEPRVCGEILCRIRHLPIVPADVSENLIRNRVTGNAVLYGLGYAVALVIATLGTRIFITLPWKAWESALLDELLHKQTSPGLNYLARAAVFFAIFLGVVAFAISVNNPWIGMTWVWENELSPLHTLQVFAGWIFAPLGISS